MISIQGLSKTYASGTKAVNNISLDVQSGEIFALLGPNGAGKSTIIRILTTLCGFDDGKVTIAEHDVDRNPANVRQSIGYVAQNTGIDFFLTGRENLRLQGHLYHMKKHDIDARITELANYFDLAQQLDQVVAGYSGGMRRKLDIAAALIHRPKVLFLDEPTLGLDTKSRHNLWKYIRELNDEHKLTILLTTHYLDEADRLAHRVGIIDNGEIKVVDTPESLKSNLHGDIVTLHFHVVEQAQQTLFWQLSQQGFVKGSTWEGNKVHLYVDNGVKCIPQIATIAEQMQLDLPQISFSRPTLDDVFVKYTGNSLNASKDEGEKWWEKWAGKGGGGGAWSNQWKKWQQNETNADASAADTQTETKTNSSEKTSDVNTSQPQSSQWPKDSGQSDWQQWQKPQTPTEPNQTEQPQTNPWWPGDNSPNKNSDGEKSWPQQNWSNDDKPKKDK